MSIQDCADNCCGLEDGSIVILQQIVWHIQKNDFVILEKKFVRKENFYTIPCESSLLDIYIVSQLSENRIWLLSKVKRKFFIIPYRNNEYVVLPLFHNESN